MTLIQFNELIAHAEQEGYALGYFESWNLESLSAVADAAEATQSPVLMGYSGIYLNHPGRLRTDCLSVLSAMGLATCRQITVPAVLIFNESPHFDRVIKAIDQGFGLVMFADDQLSLREKISQVRRIVEIAHRAGAAVEAEVDALPGIAENLIDTPEDARLTEVETALEFVEQTGVDAFAVNIGQMHLHGKQAVHLNLDLLRELNDALNVPLVLHGSTSVPEDELVEAIKYGIRKINLGSILKQTYFEAMRQAGDTTGNRYNPYEVIGSGLKEDVLMTGRIALQEKVEQYTRLFGSAGKGKLIS